MFIVIGLLIAKIIRPNKPSEEKLSSYESGENAIGDAWNKFNVKYFIIALIFILFEVELVFLFPWATVFTKKEYMQNTQNEWGWFALAEVGIFIGVLVLGLIYAWIKGYLDWVKPEQKQSDFVPVVPRKLYDKIGQSTK
jgi:NADH-quinone oxidoreductase subunit A